MKRTVRETIGGEPAERDGVCWQRRLLPNGAEEWRIKHSLIIVARDRPELFAALSERHGGEMKVLLDRRRTPRAPLMPETTQALRMARDGFMVVSEK